MGLSPRSLGGSSPLVSWFAGWPVPAAARAESSPESSRSSGSPSLTSSKVRLQAVCWAVLGLAGGNPPLTCAEKGGYGKAGRRDPRAVFLSLLLLKSFLSPSSPTVGAIFLEPFSPPLGHSTPASNLSPISFLCHSKCIVESQPHQLLRQTEEVGFSQSAHRIGLDWFRDGLMSGSNQGPEERDVFIYY
jgi:hypothetical protein